MLFRGDYAFLSNMYASQITLGHVTYSCAEAAFQAVKLADKSQRKIFANIDGSAAKRLGNKVELRSDWEEIKLKVMKWIITEKFRQNQQLKISLTVMCQGEIVEDNTWKDTFWGKCKGEGENHLGKILMEVRDELIAEDAKKFTVVEKLKPAKFHLTGVGYEDRQKWLSMFSKMKRCEAHLELEPENQYDRNAIRVMAYGKQLGYIQYNLTSTARAYLNKTGYIEFRGGTNGYLFGAFICFD